MDAIGKLGSKIVEEFERGEHVDILTRWMSNYVAELMVDTQKAAGDQQNEVKKQCAAAILELWSYRSKWPDRVRPFKELEPIISTLKGLRPEAKNAFYQQYFWERAEHKVDDDDLKQWLQLAQGTDYTARLLVEYAIEQAVRVSTAKSITWVQEAASAGAASGSDIQLSVELIDWVNETRRDEGRRKKAISDRLSRLRAFLDMAGNMEIALQSELNELSETDT